MKFETNQVKGKGRGKVLGFPTINLKIPLGFEIKNGIYAVIVTVFGRIYKGALHYGPIPTFNETEKSLEVYLIGLKDYGLTLNQNKFGSGQADYGFKTIKVEVIKYLRPIIKFKTEEKLINQIKKDIKAVLAI